jgi:hypothetical protein
MFTNLKNDRYGSLLFFEGRNKSDDPFKNYKVLKRRGNEEVRGHIRFSTPEDKDPVKVSRFMFCASMDLDSNFLPVNDWHAKSVRAFQVKVMDNLVDASLNPLEYQLNSFYAKKLNYSVEAQEVELFPSGTYDSRELDGSELASAIVKHNGKSVVEHRQSFADKIWKKQPEKIQICAGTNIEYETLTHRYHVRTPVAHGLCRQPRVLPSGSRLQFEVMLNTWSHVMQRHDTHRICRTEDIDKLKATIGQWPLDPRILTEEVEFNHYESSKCECREYAARFGDKFKVKQIIEGNFFLRRNDSELYKLYSDIDSNSLNRRKRAVESPVKSAGGQQPGRKRRRREAETQPTTTDDTSNDDNSESATPVEAGSTESSSADPSSIYDTLETFQAHATTITVPKIRMEEYIMSDGSKKQFAVFWLKNETGPTEEGFKPNDQVTFYEHILEAVYCTPGKPEKPFPVKGGGARIPFLCPRLKIINLPAGQRSYDVELSDGVFPHMIILTGMSYKRRIAVGTEICATKTSMFEPGFEIEELTVFIDNDEVYRSPWKAPIDHYLNYLKHTGRYFNKAIGGSVDFFRYQNENWCVPLRFDDRRGRRGLVTVKITFRHELTKSWDAFITKIPVEDLMLDRSKNGRRIVVLEFQFNSIFSCVY